MEQHTVRFASESEHRLLRIIAATDGVSVSTWIRDAAISRMNRDLPSVHGHVQALFTQVATEAPVIAQTDTLQTD